jgi:prepilin-type N-terminal cleavage/methylation domain-containing protein/prepilin-type processing-associated H-X9-DG protein
MRRSAGFTLVELLVVIAIIGVLVAMLLPAVQAARESGRRASCQNNLKQLMLAMHTHHDALKGFPPCRIITSGMQHGWVVDLLPYLEQGNIANNFQRDKSFYAPENQPVVTLPLPVVQCPSDPSAGTTMPLGLSGTMYGTNGVPGGYYVNHLLNSTSAAAAGLNCNPCRPILSVLNGEEGQLHPMSKVTDGTSNTMFITEQSGRNDYYVRGRRQTSNAGLTSVNWWGAWPSFQHFQYQGYTADGLNLGSVCSINCNNGQGIYSFHPGGANVTYCDGSVRFISQTAPVALVTMQLTRDGGETVNAD